MTPPVYDSLGWVRCNSSKNISLKQVVFWLAPAPGDARRPSKKFGQQVCTVEGTVLFSTIASVDFCRHCAMFYVTFMHCTLGSYPARLGLHLICKGAVRGSSVVFYRPSRASGFDATWLVGYMYTH